MLEAPREEARLALAPEEPAPLNAPPPDADDPERFCMELALPDGREPP